MKVVLFCGGLGTRLGTMTEDIPKPLVPLGSVPILCHVMEYYAHHGHRDFILCLGHKGDAIARYFLDKVDRLAGAVVVQDGCPRVNFRANTGTWRITFADTGPTANIGQRLKAVRHLLGGDKTFLANYADGVSDFPLPRLVRELGKREAVGGFLSVRPNASFHFVRQGRDGQVLSLDNVIQANAWINGGYFVFTDEIFDYIEPGDDLVEAPFARLIDRGKLFTIEHESFWRCLDTYKDLQALEDLLRSGKAPWMLWQASHSSPARPLTLHEAVGRLNSRLRAGP